MSGKLYVSRLMSRRTGFRAKISGGWWIFREGQTVPIDGPFRTAGNARRVKMAHEKSGEKSNAGQSKTHEATRRNPTTGESETRSFTQTEWKSRDKSEGWDRSDGVEDDAEDTTESEG